MKCKYTYEVVARYFKDNNCELLDTEYQGIKTKMKYKCCCGKPSIIDFDHFKRGRRCKECGKKKIGNKLRLSINDVAEYFNKHNCELLDEYKNTNSFIKFRCYCGEISEITFANFKETHKCNKCANWQHSYEYVKSFFEEHNCELQEPTYVNNHTPMTYKCSCGNISKIAFHNFQMGKRCKKCALIKRTNPDRQQMKERYLFAAKCRNMLKRCLKKLELNKEAKTKELLGYSAKELMEHIQSHPNWKSIDGPWHIDHVFPIKAFLDHDIRDLKLINSLDNLQPLPRQKNQLKSATYDKQLFITWIKERNNDKREIEEKTTPWN